jgi:hypothetical protein
MTKPNKPKTHFEQVPLEIVKKIAVIEVPADEPDKTGRPGKHPARKVRIVPTLRQRR